MESQPHQSNILHTPTRYLTVGSLALMFLFALLVRVIHLDDSRHVAEVQYRAALIARSIYFDLTSSIPEWRREANHNSVRNLPVKEPPITETFAAIGYKLLGHEDPRIPRLLTSIFWVVGGYFLYKMAKDTVSLPGAMAATAFYLFVPLGVIVSISFQPDSLMVMMFIVSIYVTLKYHETPTWSWLITSAILSGIAIFVKPLVLFPIVGAFLALAFYHADGIRGLLNRKLAVFLVAVSLPMFLYYGYQILFTGNLMKQAEVSFLPQLLLTRQYWRDWMETVLGTMGITPVIAGIIGIPIARRGDHRALLIGLLLGYVVFCLVFTYHIRYAGYYHAQFIPILALAFAPTASALVESIQKSNNRGLWSIFYVAPVGLILIVTLRSISSGISSSTYIENKDAAQEIGRLVNHSHRTVYIASYYGRPLEYYAELTGTYWPRSVSDRELVLGTQQTMSVEDRLEALGFTPEYFVITAMQEYERHHQDLREYLNAHCRILEQSDQFIIYDSCVR